MGFLLLKNIQAYLLIVLLIAVVFLYGAYRHQKQENKRQSQNVESILKMDSLRFAQQTYTKQELDTYLEYNRKDLWQFLHENRIATRRIERLITQQLNYRDTVSRAVNLQPVLEAVRNRKNIKVPVIDSTACMVVKGYVVFENDTLSLTITERVFNNKSDVVSYWERNKWRFLGIKTRIFGKRKTTVIIKDNCGITRTFVVDRIKD